MAQENEKIEVEVNAAWGWGGEALAYWICLWVLIGRIVQWKRSKKGNAGPVAPVNQLPVVTVHRSSRWFCEPRDFTLSNIDMWWTCDPCHLRVCVIEPKRYVVQPKRPIAMPCAVALFLFTTFDRSLRAVRTSPLIMTAVWSTLPPHLRGRSRAIPVDFMLGFSCIAICSLPDDKALLEARAECNEAEGPLRHQIDARAAQLIHAMKCDSRQSIDSSNIEF